jgi:hypothetical protein
MSYRWYDGTKEDTTEQFDICFPSASQTKVFQCFIKDSTLCLNYSLKHLQVLQLTHLIKPKLYPYQYEAAKKGSLTPVSGPLAH